MPQQPEVHDGQKTRQGAESEAENDCAETAALVHVSSPSVVPDDQRHRRQERGGHNAKQKQTSWADRAQFSSTVDQQRGVIQRRGHGGPRHCPRDCLNAASVGQASGEDGEECEQDRANREAAEIRNPEQLAEQNRHASPDGGEPVGQRDREHSARGQKPRRGQGPWIARPSPHDEQTCHERHQLRQPKEDERGSRPRQPVVGRFRRQKHAQVDAHPVALDDDRHRHTDPVVRAQRAPAVAVDNGEAVDGDQMVADRDSRLKRGRSGFDPGNDDCACVGRIRLESGILGTKHVAVDEKPKVAEERRRDDERPERWQPRPGGELCWPDSSQLRHVCLKGVGPLNRRRCREFCT